ncbi:MAG: CPBP family intramembrane metalloprotease, partial [Deltaproteobacteria bacterium]|nr:CPBP family intramembrane metalloprotease [Deltaproteobacteria bacterium]
VDPPLLRSAWHGIAVALVVLPVYAVGFDTWQTRVLHRERGAGVGLASPGLDWQGEPPAGTPLALSEARDGLVVHNHTRAEVVALAENQRQVVPAGGRVRVPLRDGQPLDLRTSDGRSLHQAELGASGSRIELPVTYAANFYWLILLILVQLAAVAVPEELLFRGYILGRLRVLWPPQRTVLGVPFGLAHVGAAALFAVVHLVAVPAPFRLAVFFPGLLFGWIAERSRSSLAAAVNHALCNATLAVLLRLYPP